MDLPKQKQQLPQTHRGIWSADEHDRFLKALRRFPEGPWLRLAECVGTRSTRQVQTHAQKFFEKIRRRQRGLTRSYVHSWLAREHRVDEDLISLLVSLEDLNEAGEKLSGGEHKTSINDDAVSQRRHESVKEARSSASMRSQKLPQVGGQPAFQRKLANQVVLSKIRPLRIRIRRSARNAFQAVMTQGDIGLIRNPKMDIPHIGRPSAIVTQSSLCDEANVQLPSIEVALDFFLNSIAIELADSDVRTTDLT